MKNVSRAKINDTEFSKFFYQHKIIKIIFLMQENYGGRNIYVSVLDGTLILG